MAEVTNEASKDIIEKAIKQHREFLAERIDPDFGLLDKLLANRVLSRNEYSEVKAKTLFYERNSVLLDYVLKKQHSDRLIAALLDTGQKHIVNYLRANAEYKAEFDRDWPLTSREIDILDANQEALVDLLEVSELLGLLYSSRVINRRQLEFISSKLNYIEKNETLLEILRQRSLRDYWQTIQCLRECNQCPTAAILEEGGVVVRVPASLECELDNEKEVLYVRPGFGSQNAECQTDESSCLQSTYVPSKLEQACQTEESVNLGDTGRTVNEKSQAWHEPCPQSVLKSTAVQTDLEMVGILVTKTDAECQYDTNIGVNSSSQSLFEQEHATSSTIAMRSKDFNYKEALRDCIITLSDCLDVKHGLLEHLLIKRVFNKREQEAVESERTESKQISKVLDLMSRKSPDQFKEFLEALICTNQPHVVNLIACCGDVSKIVGDFRPLGKNELHWIDRDVMNILSMDCYVDTSLLFDRLLQVGCLTKKQFQSINQSTRKTRSLMDIVRRGSLASFNRFLECLRKLYMNCNAEFVEANTDLEAIAALKNLSLNSEEGNLNNFKQMELFSRHMSLLQQELALLKRERDVATYEAYLLRQELEAVKKNDHKANLQH